MRISKTHGVASSAFGLLAMTITIAMVSVAHAQACAYRDGGYCVSAIADQTAKKLGVPTETAVWGKSKWDETLWAPEGLLGGTNYLNYYQNIWNQMVKNGKATEQERKQAFDEARKAGGTKIGGVNLVVLSARTLQQLVDKKIMTKDEAQNILNEARMTEK